MRHPRRLLGCLVLVVVVLGAVGGLALYARDQLKPVEATQDSKVLVTVAKGESLTRLAEHLEKLRVIRSSLVFRVYADFKKLPRKLKAGRFELDRGMDADEVIKVLEGPPLSQAFDVTIPDGLRAAQEAKLLQTLGLFSAQSYLAEVDKPASFPGVSALAGTPQGASWEGLAFGDTYQVLPRITPYQLLEKQVKDFQVRARAEIEQGASAVGLTPYQVVVLASIVSAEAATPKDRGLVAGVFFNRLHAGMELQSDVTVLYAQSLAGDDSTQVNTAFASPYNTYLHTGLPPGPIDSPGLAAIGAVLHPTASPYFYFLALPNGKVEYSVTLAQHEQQIAAAGEG